LSVARPADRLIWLIAVGRGRDQDDDDVLFRGELLIHVYLRVSYNIRNSAKFVRGELYIKFTGHSRDEFFGTFVDVETGTKLIMGMWSARYGCGTMY